jgi:uncharacterized membrane protein
MTTRIEPFPAKPPRPSGAVYMDAVLAPNRSLSAQGLRIVMLATAAISFVSGLFFLSLGAWPVIGFFGLDVVLVWLAFRASFRSGQRQREMVLVASDMIQVGRRPAKGPEQWWGLSPHFARVDVEDPDGWEAQVALAAGPDRLALATFLSPAERVGFARALRDAIAQARSERHSSEGRV